MEKKISWKDYCYVTRRENVAWFQKMCCTFHLVKGTEGGGCYEARMKVRWFWYLLLWLPLQLVNIVYYAWDEGLRNYDWELPRVEQGAVFYICDKRYGVEDCTYNRMDKLWESI